VKQRRWFNRRSSKLLRASGSSNRIVLLAILRLGENAYGVTIREEITSRTGREAIPEALYVALDRLEDKGFVRSQFGDPTPQRGRAKRFFSVTATGVESVARAQRSHQRLMRGVKLPGIAHALRPGSRMDFIAGY
jgi:DNA-binding PadR family transcriptional regulator